MVRRGDGSGVERVAKGLRHRLGSGGRGSVVEEG